MSRLYRSDAARERVRGWCRSRLETWDLSHETTVIDSRVGPIHVLHGGAGPPTFVYLPGTNFNAATSLSFITSLARKAEVFAVDLPGQPGLSSPQRPPRHPSESPTWISEILDALRISDKERAVMVGHSRGAAEALSAGPSQVDAIALLNPAGLARVTLTMGLLGATLPWMLRPTAARSNGLLRLMSAPGYEPSPEHVEWLTIVARDTRTVGAPPPVPQAWTDRWRSRPAMVLCGEHDVFFPPHKISLAAHDRLGIDVTEVEGVGHLSVEEAPEVVAGHLFRFLESRL